MTQIIAFVLLFAVGLWIEYTREEEKRRKDEAQRQKKAEDLYAKALRESGVGNLIAFGDFRAPDGPESEEPADLEAELVRRETEKWEVLNAGRAVATALVGSGGVTTRFSAEGVAELDVIPGCPLPVDIGLTVLEGSYTPTEFKLTRPNADTAVLRYKVAKRYLVASATTIWAKRDGRWVTVSYQVTRT